MSEFLTGLRIQSRGVNALMIRELMMRYGRGNIGFLWLVLEPMILCAGGMAARLGARIALRMPLLHCFEIGGMAFSARRFRCIVWPPIRSFSASICRRFEMRDIIPFN